VFHRVPLLEAQPFPLSSRPERTRISCHAALDKAAYAPFRKEGRMKCTNATKSNRKSGVAKWRDLRFSGLFLEMFFRPPNHADPEGRPPRTALKFYVRTWKAGESKDMQFY
jgi:hypothetical protein